jgi:hypothetical protein
MRNSARRPIRPDMPSRHLLFVVGAHVLPSKIAVGGESGGRCVDLATVRAVIEGQCSQLIEITPDQWAFLRGVYAMNVEAPPGLPSGDDVVLAQDGGDSDGLLFFVDGDRLGAPMHAPPARVHKTLRVTPAMAAGLSPSVMDWSNIIALMDAEAPKPGLRGPYRKREAV